VKPKIREVIVVEGRYDKNTLSQVVDATVIETRGFGIFSDDELLALLRRLAGARGVIVMTDSDGAGFLIRGHLKSALGGNVKHAYIPDISGKERRKRAPSRAGTLGVEGMSREVILKSLRDCGATFEGESAHAEAREPITKYDLYSLKLSGAPDASRRREELLERLSLPKLLTANALLDVLNCLFSREEFFAEFPL
jgi:ribonuclease M5